MTLMTRSNGAPMARLRDPARRRTLRRLLAVAGVVLAGIVFLFLPVRIPYSITVQGQVLPAQEWLLIRDPGGGITSALLDHRRGLTREYAVAQFDREDAMRFTLREGIDEVTTVAAGDTVGSVFSSQTGQELARLQGELLTERANLRAITSGEKASVVREAQNRIEQARAQVEAQRKIVDRLRQLAASEAASQEDLEIAEGRLLVFEAEVAVAEAALETAQTGAKQEQVELAGARISALENEIAALRSRVENLQMISPIAGTLIRPPSRDTLLVVADLDELVVLMPVPWDQGPLVIEDQPIAITGAGAKAGGRITRLEPYARTIAGRQVIYASALVEPGQGGALMPGMMIRCRIAVDRLTPLEYVARLASSVIRTGSA